jgi:hypothetical protein
LQKGSFFTLDNALQPMLLLTSDRSVFKGTLANLLWFCFNEYLGLNFFLRAKRPIGLKVHIYN